MKFQRAARTVIDEIKFYFAATAQSELQADRPRNFILRFQREAKLGLKNGRKISSRATVKFNARRKISLRRIKIYARAVGAVCGRANLKFRRKFKIYPARNSPLRNF